MEVQHLKVRVKFHDLMGRTLEANSISKLDAVFQSRASLAPMTLPIAPPGGTCAFGAPSWEWMRANIRQWAMGNGLKAEFQFSLKAGLSISAGEFRGSAMQDQCLKTLNWQIECN
jgi:hypothetical protein